jgi:hypothetical protein
MPYALKVLITVAAIGVILQPHDICAGEGERVQVQGGKIDSLSPSQYDVVTSNKPFYLKIDITAVSASDTVKRIVVDHFICLRDVSNGELRRTYSGGVAISGDHLGHGGSQSGQYLVVNGLPPGNYEAVAFVLVRADQQSPSVVDMRISRFHIKKDKNN